MFINFGEPIQKEDLHLNVADGLMHQEFNNLLQQELEQLVFEIPKKDKQKQKEKLQIKLSPFKKILLVIPAIIGLLIHLPLYLPLKKYIWKRNSRNDHYDSIMAGIIILSYPFYLILLIAIVWMATSCWWSVSLLILLPCTAWSYIQLKPQLDK